MKKLVSAFLVVTFTVVLGINPVFAEPSLDKVYADDVLEGLGKMISGDGDLETVIQEGVESGKDFLKNIGKKDNKAGTKSDNSDDIETDFDPQDVSDETIESIQTYGDYLVMYQKIIDDYLVNYENVFKNTVIYDEATFQEMRDQMEEAFKEQEKEYGAMRNAPIVGKDELVDYLT